MLVSEKGRVMVAVFSTIFSLITAMVIAFMALLAFWRPAPFTRLRMVYKLEASAPLIHEAAPLSSKLTVNYERKPIARPHIVHISVTNIGKRDVPSTAFDQQLPLRIDLDAEIVAILDATPRPSTVSKPEASARGTELSIGPSLIPNHVTLDFLLLVDGSCNALTHKSSLNDVELRQIVLVQRIRSEVKTVAGWVAIAFVVWWIIQQPADAAHLVHNVGEFFNEAATSLARFISSI
jgi:hypothetical protein